MAFHCNGSVPVYSLSLLCFSINGIQQSGVLLKGNVLYFLIPKLNSYGMQVSQRRQGAVCTQPILYMCMVSPLNYLKSV